MSSLQTEPRKRPKPDVAPVAQQRWHVITCEYPPQNGGVSDYTQSLAAALAAWGDQVHVWCPPAAAGRDHSGVAVHRDLGSFGPADLQRIEEQLEQFPQPRKLLVQWVPHGYGRRSMNIGFCWWLWKRSARHGDTVELMVHEPYLPFEAGAWRQNMAALVHRLMTIVLLRSTRQVWVSIPRWVACLSPYTLGRKVRFQWLPIFSNIPVVDDSSRVLAIRRKYLADGRLLIGHFGTYGSLITRLLEPILVQLAAEQNPDTLLLMGLGSEQFRERLIQKEPGLADRLVATGPLSSDQLSCHLSACDLLIQPYPDGVSSRRTSCMAGLSHGKPMITTEGELSEPLWRESEAVAIAAAGDTAAFVELVRRYGSDASERQRLGRKASELYQDHFDISHIVSALRRGSPARGPECEF